MDRFYFVRDRRDSLVKPYMTELAEGGPDDGAGAGRCGAGDPNDRKRRCWNYQRRLDKDVLEHNETPCCGAVLFTTRD